MLCCGYVNSLEGGHPVRRTTAKLEVAGRRSCKKMRCFRVAPPPPAASADTMNLQTLKFCRVAPKHSRGRLEQHRRSRRGRRRYSQEPHFFTASEGAIQLHGANI